MHKQRAICKQIKLKSIIMNSVVAHHDDLLYLFYIPPLAPLYNRTDPEYAIMKRQINIWVNFAYHG